MRPVAEEAAAVGEGAGRGAAGVAAAPPSPPPMLLPPHSRASTGGLEEEAGAAEVVASTAGRVAAAEGAGVGGAGTGALLPCTQCGPEEEKGAVAEATKASRMRSKESHTEPATIIGGGGGGVSG